MFLSIIIPVHNVEQYLHDCLNSIVAQSYHDYEIICVNDGSTDRSLAILQEYKLKYKNIILINSLNGGTASARNIGIENAQGDYIWFVDSDDWIEKDSLQLLNDKLIVKSLDILCFNGKLKYEEDLREEHDQGIEETLLSGWEYYNKYALIPRKFSFICVVLRLFRREFLLNNLLFFKKGIEHEDNLWIPKVMYYAQSVAVIPDSLYVYQIHEGSKMRTISFKQVEDTITVANNLSDFFIPIKNINKKQVYREIAGEYFGAYMPEKLKLYGKKDKHINKLINWKNFKEVSVYPRHKRIFLLLSINPVLFRWYIYFEDFLKKTIQH